MDKKQAMREAMRFQLIQEFAQIDERTREERVDRYLEIDRQKIIGEHHFAHASTECIHLYTHGFFISTVMTTQAVNVGFDELLDKLGNRAAFDILAEFCDDFPASCDRTEHDIFRCAASAFTGSFLRLPPIQKTRRRYFSL